jgi:hypothetical protein
MPLIYTICFQIMIIHNLKEIMVIPIICWQSTIAYRLDENKANKWMDIAWFLHSSCTLHAIDLPFDGTAWLYRKSYANPSH